MTKERERKQDEENKLKIIQNERKKQEKILWKKKSDYGDMTQHENTVFVCFIFSVSL